MTFPRVRILHILPLALLAAVALLPLGCGSEPGVTSYDVPKTTDTGKKPNAAAGDYRMLGAMFPADDPKWFFKISGPVAEMAKYEAEFDEMLKTVKLGGDAPLEFTPPKSWTRGEGRDSGFVKVYATVTPPNSKSEVSITQSGGGVDLNLGRWVGLIGLQSGANDLAKYTKPITTASGVKGLRVDLTGPTDPATKRGPMMPAGHP